MIPPDQDYWPFLWSCRLCFASRCHFRLLAAKDSPCNRGEGSLQCKIDKHSYQGLVVFFSFDHKKTW